MSGLLLLFLAKIMLSAGMVISITLVAEKMSTRFAGVLLGFPLGAGLTFLFTGIEQGQAFAAASTPWTIQGLSATLVFCLCYNQTSVHDRGTTSLNLLLPTLWGIAGFFATAYLLHHILAQLAYLRVFVVTAVFIGSAVFFRRSSSPAIRRNVPATKTILMSRAMFASLIIVAITAVAAQVGENWTGIFAAFPTTLLPSILVLHYHYGPATIPAIFREIPLGMLAIVVFCAAVSVCFPLFGVYFGIVIAYAIALLYLLIYELFLRSLLDRLFEKYCHLGSSI